MLRIHNSLSRRKEPFVPLHDGRVRMYVCGITVYDYCHIGHARMLVVFDIVQRWLRASGYELTYVRNITDIDDKIIKRAVDNDETIRSLTDRFIRAMHEDADALGVQRPDREPRATEFVPQMLGMIGRLVRNGHAYTADDGDVNYAVRSFAAYGRLSGKSLDDLRAGERVAVVDGKHDPLDFVLWKAAKSGDPDGARWDSPFGAGRPGWHIECSAMATALLGETLDIHGGGADLQFPHHENEIAQSEGARTESRGEPFARYWMHNGFVRVDDEKMSKSLGNFFTIREVLEWVRDPEVVRYFMVGSHYRGPINYTPDSLTQADTALERLYLALRGVSPAVPAPATAATQRFVAAMDDDFNTSIAVAELQSLARELNTAKAAGRLDEAAAVAGELKVLGSRLGLLGLEPETFLRKRPLKMPGQQGESAAPASEGLGDDEIERLIEARAAARKAKDFKESDRIRDALAAGGVLLEDQPGGKTLWRRK